MPELNNLRYVSYSTGLYGKHQKDGITLQLICEHTNNNYHVIFNVDIRRKRNLKNHKAGSLLPKGRFSVKPRSAFYAFWTSTGLDMPPRLSAFNDYMGKLKSLTFSADLSKGTRLDACSLRPFFSNNNQTNLEQFPNNRQTTTPNSDLMETRKLTVVQRDLTTYPNNYVISKQVSTNTSNSISPIDETKRVQSQTTDEWLDEYEEQWALECDELF